MEEDMEEDMEGGSGGGYGGGNSGGYGGGYEGGEGVNMEEEEDLEAPAHYEFNYGVEDAHTGDRKQQSESRVGDTVKGQYSLAEPDGTIRVVKYTADPHNGFNAIVSRIGHAAHPQIVTKAVVATHGYGGGIGLGGGVGLGGGIGLGGHGGGRELGGYGGGIGLGGLGGHGGY
ncbi:hypothetical protein NQ314_006248 [Rhamnusium bicolor]|uniref:Uncharacterized protein n=1 Tax=Rhamnusium bicolor TaxID=1586634 RepID=A0AAV8Z5Y0_9CUCU|nr:hypothetical protein NQ314_006248 [Rhamnusium bicolor]